MIQKWMSHRLIKKNHINHTRIWFICSILIIFMFTNVYQVSAKCTELSCMNGGFCKNGSCLCSEGWQGDQCQFCGGKVRLTNTSGVINDGIGNYSVGVKCSWLIDATDYSDKYGRKDRTPTIRLHLEEFATECGWDHLYIFDGDSVNSPLLAVFSGLMYRQNVSIRRIPEVVASSGSALLHFFSDDAYNMSGFNISYKIDGCPSLTSNTVCSDNGICETDGTCTCNINYTGLACHIPVCPNNCSAHFNKGICDRIINRCICNSGYAGSDCSQSTSMGYWETVINELAIPAGSASHSAAIWGDTLYILGGENYQRTNQLYMYDFNGKVWEIPHITGGSVPEKRYAASAVLYGDKIYLYGGVIESSGISGELWAFDVSAKTWENITVKTEMCLHSNLMCGPIKTAGHTATLIPRMSGNKKHNVEQYMIVIFGHSPQFGYLNTVQEYNFVTREWKIIQTKGYPVKGGFGHSASYDVLTEKIYVYGGIISESESSQLLSDQLYSYDPSTQTWMLLSASPTSRFLHTATFVTPGLMIVFGGNTHNDTSHSFGAKCYSNDLILYDVLCDTWHNQDMPDDLYSDLSRFGHSAVVFEEKMYIFGGFDGQMLSDLLKYTPGSCRDFHKPEICLNARPGVKCVWDIQENSCIEIRRIPPKLLFDRDQEAYHFCPKERKSSKVLHEKCSEHTDCEGCLSTSHGCFYCGNGICSKEKCANKNMHFIKSLEDCPSSDKSAICAQLHSCHACNSNPNCRFDYDTTKCRPNTNHTYENDQLPCPPNCAALTSCANCTVEECIWCQNEQRCVDKNAYTVSFPYGQCREWTTTTNKCRPSLNGKSQCAFYKTCNQCRDDPECGWCDDGSNTGLGKCLAGGDSGPENKNECTNQWYFTQCPECQCNGHSVCSDGNICIQPCANLTYGHNCEKCRPGYWGNPINGGSCQKCECNGHASYCHSDTGKCFCSSKGLIGDHCDKCDSANHYHGDPNRGSCYYELTIDYQFTFNLSKKEDRYFTQINFRNSPVKADIDADFAITCSVLAKINITIRTPGNAEKPLFTGINCTTFRYRFSKTEHNFGVEDNKTLTTFYVYVYDFQTPLWIQIAFSQYPKLNLQQFFITFSSCFLLLLLLAALLWKIKQKIDMFRRRQRLFVEMEQMASRPFSQVLVEIENRDTDTVDGVPHINNKKRRKECPSPIALEPCAGNKAAVLSLLVRLPTGGLQHAPPGQAVSLAVASSLVTLGNPRRPSLDNIKEPKTKRKQIQHPD